MVAISNTSGPAPSLNRRPPALPREIIDSILTALISLYDCDPAYQWTHFRSLTSFHRQQIDQQFPRKWLPKLMLTLYELPNLNLDYHAKKLCKDKDIVEYRMKCTENVIVQRNDLYSIIMRTTYPLGDDSRRSKSLILRMGKGALCGGIPGGGILSDMQLPELSASDSGATISFNWKEAFTRLFGEEMLMRRYKAVMLGRFLPTVKTRKRLARNQEIHTFLLKAYQPLRRELLTRYRDHLSSFIPPPSKSGERRTVPAATPFDVMAHVPADLRANYIPDESLFKHNIQKLIKDEESMVLHVPGWKNLPESELQVLTATERRSSNSWCTGG